MGKKPSAKSANAKSGKIEAKIEAKSGKNNLWLVVGGAAIMIALVWITLRTTQPNIAGQFGTAGTAGTSDEAGKPGKAPVTLIATLSPEMYTGKARAAYQAAKDIPEILAQLPCYCGCMESLGHRSNLYCFSDTHGAICDLCQSIALDAQEMHRKGMPIEKIRDNIRTTYGNVRM